MIFALGVFITKLLLYFNLIFSVMSSYKCVFSRAFPKGFRLVLPSVWASNVCQSLLHCAFWHVILTKGRSHNIIEHVESRFLTLENNFCPLFFSTQKLDNKIASNKILFLVFLKSFNWLKITSQTELFGGVFYTLKEVFWYLPKMEINYFYSLADRLQVT